MEQKIIGVGAMNTYAADFVRSLVRGTQATVVALQGDLGAGKTTFVQGVAKALGITEPITSPTFVIQKIYPLVGQIFEHLVHIDAYRLKSAHELAVLRWEETLRNPGNLVCIEWPERIVEAIPKGVVWFSLRFIDEQTRGIERTQRS